MREQFARETELGTMPLRDAVEQVTGTLAEEVTALGAAFRTRGKADLRRLNQIQRQVESEQGSLARDVTVAYLLASARRRDTEETYFDHQLKGRHGTLG